MNENFVTADAIGKNKLTNQAKSLRRWEFFAFIWVYFRVGAPPHKSQSFSVSRKWLIRNSESTLKESCVHI